MDRLQNRLPRILLGFFLAAETLLCASQGPGQNLVLNDLWTRDQVLGELPAREALAEKGFSFDIAYIGEVFGNAHGGIQTRDSVRWRDDWSLFAELDTETAGWWEGGQFFLHLQSQSGDSITEEFVGDFQVLSNIDADDFSQVSEFWYKHWSPSGLASLKLGKLEGNADFAFVDFGVEFINSSAGFAPTIPLTTYPDQDWGVVADLNPVDWFSLTAGVYQGDPDGGRSVGATLRNLDSPMYMIQPALHYNLRGQEGSFRFGWWLNETPGEDFRGESYDDQSGWYLTLDQWIYKENPDDDEDEQGIGLFAQYGSSDERKWEAHRFIGGGIIGTGLAPGRDDDKVGVYCGHVELSEEPGAGFEEDSETVVEVFYKYQVTPYCSIKPDLQYIRNPGGTDNPNALALGMRLELTF
jgi:porin